ncbi:MAG: DNA polymerase III subunit delta [Tannerella sp.]|jgi:DNA polymerase-3 subunit delta'|nr:DNA polymerase III subunit delta [Tannerella sp.]
MYFKDVIGQDELKRYLTGAARKGIVPHALMFCGAEGYGSFHLALAYAQYLNCTDRSDEDACGKCPSCVKYDALAHPDLHFVFPMVQNKEKKKETCDDYHTEWRSFLKSQTAEHTYFDIDTWLTSLGAENKAATIYAAESDKILHKMNMKIYEAAYRVLFIWMPERMNISCSNKLLKIIEEPYPNTAIVMVSPEPNNVLGTIYSRSQLVQVRPIPHDMLVNQLVTELNLDETLARQTAHLANGNYLKATRLLSESEDEAFFLEQFKLIMRNGWARNIVGMKQFAEEMASLGREKQKNFLAYCQRQIRENFLLCLSEPALNYLNNDEAAFSVNFHKYVNERNITGLMDEFSLAEAHIGQNVNSKMVFFDLSMRITVLVKA